MLLFIFGLGGSFLLIALIFLILWIWALADLLNSEFKDSTNKLIWALIIIFTAPLGPVLYLIIGRDTKIRG